MIVLVHGFQSGSTEIYGSGTSPQSLFIYRFEFWVFLYLGLSDFYIYCFTHIVYGEDFTKHKNLSQLLPLVILTEIGLQS